MMSVSTSSVDPASFFPEPDSNAVVREITVFWGFVMVSFASMSLSLLHYLLKVTTVAFSSRSFCEILLLLPLCALSEDSLRNTLVRTSGMGGALSLVEDRFPSVSNEISEFWLDSDKTSVRILREMH